MRIKRTNTYRNPRNLKRHPNHVRIHPAKKITLLGKWIGDIGPTVPIVVDEYGFVLAGWAIVLAAIEIGIEKIPVVVLTGLSEARTHFNRAGRGGLCRSRRENQTRIFGDRTMSMFNIRDLDAALRLRFDIFLMMVCYTLNPGKPYLDNWHIDAMVFRANEIMRGNIRRLIVNVPPRNLKTMRSCLVPTTGPMASSLP